jgi:hypothetical protein
MSKPERNSPCPCGSGKKYKKCCLATDTVPVTDLIWDRMRRTEGELTEDLLRHARKHYGSDAIDEAWDEFTLWGDIPAELEAEPAVEPMFVAWFPFIWIPDNAEREPDERYPELPIARHYMDKRRDDLDSFEQRFISEAYLQPYSFFVVSDVVPGRRMTLNDLFLDREVTVLERQASEVVPKGSILYTRIVTLDTVSIMLGCAPISIPPRYLDEFAHIKQKLPERFPNYDQNTLLQLDLETRRLYYDITWELYHPEPPELRNTDGEPIEFTQLQYDLKCSPREALDALASLSLMKTEELLEDAEYDSGGELIAIELPWQRTGNAQHNSWEATVLGLISIDHERMTVDVNSPERADAIKRKIVRRLGKRAKLLRREVTPSEKVFEDAMNRPSDREEPSALEDDMMQDPEVQARIKEMADRHWDEWLDTPIPALQGQTPRQAAESEEGQEKLKRLLIQLEYMMKEESLLSIDPDVLRRTLGLND